MIATRRCKVLDLMVDIVAHAWCSMLALVMRDEVCPREGATEQLRSKCDRTLQAPIIRNLLFIGIGAVLGYQPDLSKSQSECTLGQTMIVRQASSLYRRVGGGIAIETMMVSDHALD
jgi:hypothetical protein